MNNNKWYRKPGKQGDVVVSTRVRLARNFRDYPFPGKMTADQRDDVNELVRKALADSDDPLAAGLGYSAPGTLSTDARRAMAERHLVTREFAESGRQRAMLLSEDESVCLLLCDRDHVRLQVMAAGLAPEEAYAAADRLDDVIGRRAAYAFDAKWGYLTERPTDLGTGMKASVLLHLPALEATGDIETLAKAVSKIGLSLRGTFGEGSSVSGSLYQLSNQITLGMDEAAALQNLQAVTEQVIEQEQQARQNLPALATEDAAWRALGLLQNARILPVREFTDNLSRLRLGVSMGLIPSVSPETLNALNAELHPATLLLGHPDADSTEKRDVIRAAAVREQLG